MCPTVASWAKCGFLGRDQISDWRDVAEAEMVCVQEPLPWRAAHRA